MALDNHGPKDINPNGESFLDDKKMGAGNGAGDIDGEMGQGSRFGSSNKSAGARIAPVLPHLQGYDFGSDDSGSDILGKQIELEADNAIQYRTCSVCSFLLAMF